MRKNRSDSFRKSNRASSSGLCDGEATHTKAINKFFVIKLIKRTRENEKLEKPDNKQSERNQSASSRARVRRGPLLDGHQVKGES